MIEPVYYQIMLLLTGLWVILFFLNLRGLLDCFCSWGRRGAFVLLAIILWAVFLILWVAPRGHQVYFDEYYYLSTAANLQEQGRATFSWTAGDPPRKQDFEYSWPPYPIGWPFFLSLIIKLIPGEAAGWWMNGFFCLALVPAMAALGWMLFRSRAVALGAAFLITLLPVYLRLAGSGTAMPIAVFFSVITFGLFWFTLEKPSSCKFLLALSTLALALNTRPDDWLVLIPIGIALYLRRTSPLPRPMQMSGLYWSGCMVLALLALAPPLIIMGGALDDPKWPLFMSSWSGSSLGGTLIANLKSHLYFWLGLGQHPVAITLLGMWGAIRLAARRNWDKMFLLCGWFASYILVMLPFPFWDPSALAGVDSWRFALVCYPPGLILAALGMEGFLAWGGLAGGSRGEAQAENASLRPCKGSNLGRKVSGGDPGREGCSPGEISHKSAGMIILATLVLMLATPFIYRHHIHATTPWQSLDDGLRRALSGQNSADPVWVDEPDLYMMLRWGPGRNVTMLPSGPVSSWGEHPTRGLLLVRGGINRDLLPLVKSRPLWQRQAEGQNFLLYRFKTQLPDSGPDRIPGGK